MISLFDVVDFRPPTAYTHTLSLQLFVLYGIFLQFVLLITTCVRGIMYYNQNWREIDYDKYMRNRLFLFLMGYSFTLD